MGSRAHQVERWSAGYTPEGFEGVVGLGRGSCVAPDDRAHCPEAQLLREGRPRRHLQKGEEAVDLIRSLRDVLAICLHRAVPLREPHASRPRDRMPDVLTCDQGPSRWMPTVL